MGEVKHAAGPWEVVDNSWEVSTVYAPNGSVVATVAIHHEVTEETQDEMERIKDANARLISAAPDLLEACRLLVTYDSSDDFSGTSMMLAYDDAITAARAAISRATGATDDRA